MRERFGARPAAPCRSRAPPGPQGHHSRSPTPAARSSHPHVPVTPPLFPPSLLPSPSPICSSRLPSAGSSTPHPFSSPHRPRSRRLSLPPPCRWGCGSREAERAGRGVGGRRLRTPKMAAVELEWVPETLYNTAISAVVDSYGRARRRDIRSLPENIQFDVYYKVRAGSGALREAGPGPGLRGREGRRAGLGSWGPGLP